MTYSRCILLTSIIAQDLFATKDEVKDLGPNEYLIPQFGLYEVE